ncbi:MAG TPA: anti-sigma regulatory factor [Desulfobaccales bacterium]|nr:anti-sigma regulatory factor [Desulfobaccales bacterium]
MAEKNARRGSGLPRRRKEIAWHKIQAPVPVVGTGSGSLEVLKLSPAAAESSGAVAKAERIWSISMKEVNILNGDDVIRARQSAREIARKLGFKIVEQIHIATAAAELSRNVYQYAGCGKVIIKSLTDNGNRGIEIVVEDQGPGIADISLPWQDDMVPNHGGRGLPGTKRLMDEFEIDSHTGGGTRVIIRKWLK